MSIWRKEKPTSTGFYISSAAKYPKTIRYWNGQKWSEPILYVDGCQPDLKKVKLSSLQYTGARDRSVIEWSVKLAD